jgi:hypothetical protein
MEMRNVILSTVSNPPAEFVNLNSMMNLLDNNCYYKVNEPLRHVKINNLFARSVAEKHVTGQIYVDRSCTLMACPCFSEKQGTRNLTVTWWIIF